MHMCLYIFSKQYNSNTVSDFMERYDEHKEVEPYVYLTKKEAIKQKRDEIERIRTTNYQQFLENPTIFKEKYGENYTKYFENDFPKKLSYTDEQCYKEMLEEYCEDDRHPVGPNGEIMSTYNPDSKWDWYELGGRWQGVLKTKDGQETTACQLKDLNIDELEGSYSFLTLKDEWLERDDYKDEEFDKKFKEYVKSLDPNTWIIQVDYHI